MQLKHPRATITDPMGHDQENKSRDTDFFGHNFAAGQRAGRSSTCPEGAVEAAIVTDKEGARARIEARAVGTGTDC